MPTDWTEAEVRYAVQDYFDMLFRELKGEEYVKSEHNKLLSQILASRSKGSIEFKHQNISAVLLELELPYIDGYKPRKNVQGLLRTVVNEYAEKCRPKLEQVAATAEVEEPAKAFNLEHVLVPPPEFVLKPPKKGTPQLKAPHLLNFPERDARNRKLGQMGEEFVLQFETFRLEKAGKKDLAKRIEWTSQKDDTAGFDILSFTDVGKEMFIEVKTTNYGRAFPFIISQSEIKFSEARAEDYCLYRLFTYRTDPRLFILPGDIKKHCQLEPKTFRASFG